MAKEISTIVANFTGGPASGKSTTASLVFGLLKAAGIDCEYVPEYAKDLVWEGSFHNLNNQALVLGNQFHRVWRLQSKVDVVLTDSPIYLSAIYNPGFGKTFDDLAIELFKRQHNVTYFMDRTGEYNPNGRYQTEAEAIEIDKNIAKLLKEHDIPYKRVNATLCGASLIAEDIYFQVKKTHLNISLSMGTVA